MPPRERERVDNAAARPFNQNSRRNIMSRADTICLKYTPRRDDAPRGMDREKMVRLRLFKYCVAGEEATGTQIGRRERYKEIKKIGRLGLSKYCVARDEAKETQIGRMIRHIETYKQNR